jgi:long-chain acyl-CoA synthetase
MLRAKTQGMARSESYRYATRLAEDSIRALAAGRVLSFDESATVEDQRRALSTGGSES